MSVKIIRFNIIQEGARKTKAECSIEANGFRINGVRLIKRTNGEMVVSFPFWKDPTGGTHEYMYAIDRQLEEEINSLIKQTYVTTTGIDITPEIPEPVLNADFGEIDSLRNINMKLKNHGVVDPYPPPLPTLPKQSVEPEQPTEDVFLEKESNLSLEPVLTSSGEQERTRTKNKASVHNFIKRRWSIKKG